jgi:hypothetical protein
MTWWTCQVNSYSVGGAEGFCDQLGVTLSDMLKVHGRQWKNKAKGMVHPFHLLLRVREFQNNWFITVEMENLFTDYGDQSTGPSLATIVSKPRDSRACNRLRKAMIYYSKESLAAAKLISFNRSFATTTTLLDSSTSEETVTPTSQSAPSAVPPSTPAAAITSSNSAVPAVTPITATTRAIPSSTTLEQCIDVAKQFRRQTYPLGKADEADAKHIARYSGILLRRCSGINTCHCE